MSSPWGGRSQRRCDNFEKNAKFSFSPFRDMTNITEFLETVIARLRQYEKCCDEADVKWGKWNQDKPKQSRPEDYQLITWFVAFIVCYHTFYSQYFIICAVFTIVARRCTYVLLTSLWCILSAWLDQFNNQCWKSVRCSSYSHCYTLSISPFFYDLWDRQ